MRFALIFKKSLICLCRILLSVKKWSVLMLGMLSHSIFSKSNYAFRPYWTTVIITTLRKFHWKQKSFYLYGKKCVTKNEFGIKTNSWAVLQIRIWLNMFVRKLNWNGRKQDNMHVYQFLMTSSTTFLQTKASCQKMLLNSESRAIQNCKLHTIRWAFIDFLM